MEQQFAEVQAALGEAQAALAERDAQIAAYEQDFSAMDEHSSVSRTAAAGCAAEPALVGPCAPLPCPPPL